MTNPTHPEAVVAAFAEAAEMTPAAAAATLATLEDRGLLVVPAPLADHLQVLAERAEEFAGYAGDDDGVFVITADGLDEAEFLTPEYTVGDLRTLAASLDSCPRQHEPAAGVDTSS